MGNISSHLSSTGDYFCRIAGVKTLLDNSSGDQQICRLPHDIKALYTSSSGFSNSPPQRRWFSPVMDSGSISAYSSELAEGSGSGWFGYYASSGSGRQELVANWLGSGHTYTDGADAYKHLINVMIKYNEWLGSGYEFNGILFESEGSHYSKGNSDSVLNGEIKNYIECRKIVGGGSGCGSGSGLRVLPSDFKFGWIPGVQGVKYGPPQVHPNAIGCDLFVIQTYDMSLITYTPGDPIYYTLVSEPGKVIYLTPDTRLSGGPDVLAIHIGSDSGSGILYGSGISLAPIPDNTAAGTLETIGRWMANAFIRQQKQPDNTTGYPIPTISIPCRGISCNAQIIYENIHKLMFAFKCDGCSTGSGSGDLTTRIMGNGGSYDGPRLIYDSLGSEVTANQYTYISQGFKEEMRDLINAYLELGSGSGWSSGSGMCGNCLQSSGLFSPINGDGSTNPLSDNDIRTGVWNYFSKYPSDYCGSPPLQPCSTHICNIP